MGGPPKLRSILPGQGARAEGLGMKDEDVGFTYWWQAGKKEIWSLHIPYNII